LGVLDAAECPPTFGVSVSVQALLPAATKLVIAAVEASEDDAGAAARTRTARLKPVMRWSGSLPLEAHRNTVGAVVHARRWAQFTVALTVAPGSPITQAAEVV